jgi:hypothetical protein
MNDPFATFYGGYDRVEVRRQTLLRIGWLQVAIGVALVFLLLFVAADVSAIETPPAAVDVTSVQWYVLGAVVASTGGFSVHAGQSFILSETCQLFCYNFKAATVSSPFQLAKLTIVNQPVQFVNLTIRAPSGGYSGALGITFVVGPLASVAGRPV